MALEDRIRLATRMCGVMLFQLEQERNRKKGDDWINDSEEDLLERVEQEVKELRKVVEAGPVVNSGPRGLLRWKWKVLREAADVANMAGMVADAMSALNVLDEHDSKDHL